MPPSRQPFSFSIDFLRVWNTRSVRSVRFNCFRRRYATDPHTTPPNSASASTNGAQQKISRFERLMNRLPKFTRSHLSALRNAPISHISAFLILHELTAILPLFGLAGVFHYTDWLPPWFIEMNGVKEGTRRFGNWMRKRGWISEEERREAQREADDAGADDAQFNVSEEEEKAKKGITSRVASKAWSGVKAAGAQVATAEGRGQVWGRGDMGVRLVVEFATAYALVKALIIPRVVFSVWATPWFARRTVVPVGNWVKRLFGRGKTKGVNLNAEVRKP